MTAKARSNFRRIIGQLDKTNADKKILKIVNQATEFLTENDCGWDAVGMFLLPDYVFLSQRRKQQRTVQAAAKVATALMPTKNGAEPLGRDGRAMLKMAITRHADWAVVRDTLGIDMSHTTVDELIAVGQLLKIDERFLKLFEDGTGALVGATEHTIVDLEELIAKKDEGNGSV
jgi:hypothetical protein